MQGALGAMGVLTLDQTGAAAHPASRTNRSGKSGKLTLVQMNDSHGYMDLHLEWFPGPHGAEYRKAGGYARIATLLKQIRNEAGGQVLFLDNGDTFHGTYPVVESRGIVLLPIMKALHPQAMTVHWDFAYGPEQLQSLAAALPYPVLATNVYRRTTGDRFLRPYSVEETGGLKIGIIGIASNIIDKTMPPQFSEGLRFTSGQEDLPGLIEEVRNREKVDLVVVLSHLGFPQDMKLMADVPGVDVLLSSHTHHRLFAPVLQGATLIIQSGSHGAFLGRLDLDVENGKIGAYRHQLIEVAESIQPEPEVEEMVRAALAPFRDEFESVVGEISTALNRNLNLESTMDNFLLQSVREVADTSLVFSNGWRWGAPVKPGAITQQDLYNILPWSVPIATVEITGEEMRRMLEENLERTFSADPLKQLGGYLKRGVGLTAYVKIENPAGTRIQKLFVGEEELNPEKVYTAAYLIEQGVPVEFGRNRKRLSTDAHGAMVAYLRKHKPAAAELNGSIIAN